MNSAIHVLLHIKMFREELIKLVNPFIKNIKYYLIEISRPLKKITNEINEEFLSKSYSPINFKNYFQKIHLVKKMK